MFSQNSHNKTNIQEANKHLKLLHSKINEVEQHLAEKEILFGEREKELSDALENTILSKNDQINALENELHKKDAEIVNLKHSLHERDSIIARLKHKCEVLDYITKHKFVLEDIVSVLSGVQRLDIKGPSRVADGLKDEIGTCDSSGFSKKTEAHGISELNMATAQSEKGQQTYRTFDGRFSISEMDDEIDDKPLGDIPEDVFSKQRRDKELYL